MEIPSSLPIQDLNSTWSFSVLHTVMLAPSGPSFFSWVEIQVIIEILIKPWGGLLTFFSVINNNMS
jgi:hypothetical protein